jgi:hypothetical protein
MENLQMINFNSFNKSAEDLEEASLKMKIAARGKAETELKKIGGEDAQMAAFLVNQGDMKELNKLMTKMPAATQSKIQSVLDKHLKEEVKHDRYLRAHGKKAKGEGNWMFTSKRMGEPSESESVTVRGNLAAAAKEAAKKLGVKDVYVMEQVELDETSPMIKDPEKRVFNDKKSAFAYKAKHGGKVQKRIYTDSRSGRQSISYQVVKEETDLDEQEDLKIKQ